MVLVALFKIRFEFVSHGFYFVLYYGVIVLSGVLGGEASVISAVIGSITAVVVFLTKFGRDPFALDNVDVIGLLTFLIEAVILAYISNIFYQSEFFLRRLLETISDPFLVIGSGGEYLYANTSAKKLVGRKYLYGRQAWDIFPKKGSKIYEYCQDAIKTNKEVGKVYYSLNLRSWVDLRVYPSELGISVLFKNITQQKQTEARLAEKEEQFQRLIDSNVIGVAIEDSKGRIYYANDVFLETVGYTSRDLAEGKLNWRELTPEKWLKVDDEWQQELFSEGSVKPYEKEYLHKNGTLVPVLKGAAMINRHQHTSVVFILDISDRKEVEKRKDEFISIASHELKTPLTSIKGYTQLLLNQLKPEKNKNTLAKKYLERMLGQINRLTYLVDDLLDVKKIQEGKLEINPEIVDLVSLIRNAAREMKTVTNGHKIIFEPKVSAIVLADYYRIYQVIINLLNNSVKYSPASSKIIVILKKNKTTATVSVRDEGTGISLRQQKRIFQKYYQIKPEQTLTKEGLGLGLYISSEIINKHQGKIWVKSPLYSRKEQNSTIRYGTSVNFSLPLNEEITI